MERFVLFISLSYKSVFKKKIILCNLKGTRFIRSNWDHCEFIKEILELFNSLLLLKSNIKKTKIYAYLAQRSWREKNALFVLF